MVRHFPDRLPDPAEAYQELSVWRQLWLQLWGRVSLGPYQLPEWSEPIKVFLLCCQCGELHVSYREGFAAQLRCKGARVA